jgi:hypothetical protein
MTLEASGVLAKIVDDVAAANAKAGHVLRERGRARSDPGVGTARAQHRGQRHIFELRRSAPKGRGASAEFGGFVGHGTLRDVASAVPMDGPHRY